jgi:hypothetical protein
MFIIYLFYYFFHSEHFARIIDLRHSWRTADLVYAGRLRAPYESIENETTQYLSSLLGESRKEDPEVTDRR